MSAIAFYRQLRAVGVDEDVACQMTEQFEQEIAIVRREMLEKLSVNMFALDAAEPARAAAESALDRRRRLDRERKRGRRAVSAPNADMSADASADEVGDGVEFNGICRNGAADMSADICGQDADAALEIPSPEKVSPTPPLKQTPSLPSVDKSTSGDSLRAPTREAPPMPDFDEPDLDVVNTSTPEAVVDAEFVDLGRPAELFGDRPSTALAVAPTTRPAKRARRGAALPLDEQAFDRFWSLYPRKVAKDRARVAFAKAFGRIVGHDPPVEVILRGLEASIRFWQNKGTETEYLPHPATWLNDSRWNDEHDSGLGQPGIGSRQSEHGRRFQQMVRGAANLADRIERGRQGGG